MVDLKEKNYNMQAKVIIKAMIDEYRKYKLDLSNQNTNEALCSLWQSSRPVGLIDYCNSVLFITNDGFPKSITFYINKKDLRGRFILHYETDSNGHCMKCTEVKELCY